MHTINTKTLIYTAKAGYIDDCLVKIVHLAAILEIFKSEKLPKDDSLSSLGFFKRALKAIQIHQKTFVIPDFQVQPKIPIWQPDYTNNRGV